MHSDCAFQEYRFDILLPQPLPITRETSVRVHRHKTKTIPSLILTYFDYL